MSVTAYVLRVVVDTVQIDIESGTPKVANTGCLSEGEAVGCFTMAYQANAAQGKAEDFIRTNWNK